jgi:hypothetical protein
MRDINRIDPFLKEVGKIWKKNPDLRFGQMMENFRRDYGDLFFLEEEDFLKNLKEYMERTE